MELKIKERRQISIDTPFAPNQQCLYTCCMHYANLQNTFFLPHQEQVNDFTIFCT